MGYKIIDPGKRPMVVSPWGRADLGNETKGRFVRDAVDNLERMLHDLAGNLEGSEAHRQPSSSSYSLIDVPGIM